MADPQGVAMWLVDVITEAVAKDENLSDFALHVGDNRVAMVTPEDPAVYLITVQEAQLVPASNQESAPASRQVKS